MAALEVEDGQKEIFNKLSNEKTKTELLIKKSIKNAFNGRL